MKMKKPKQECNAISELASALNILYSEAERIFVKGKPMTAEFRVEVVELRGSLLERSVFSSEDDEWDGSITFMGGDVFRLARGDYYIDIDVMEVDEVDFLGLDLEGEVFEVGDVRAVVATRGVDLGGTSVAFKDLEQLSIEVLGRLGYETPKKAETK